MTSLGVPGVGELVDKPFGWLDFEPEPDMTGDGEGDPNKHYLTIGVWDRGAFDEELAVIVHRTCPDEAGREKFPLDHSIVDAKRDIAKRIVHLLNTYGLEDSDER